MAAPVPRQKGHAAALQLAQHESVGRRAKGRFHALLAHVGESGHRVEPAAADDSDFRFHVMISSVFEPQINTDEHR